MQQNQIKVDTSKYVIFKYVLHFLTT